MVTTQYYSVIVFIIGLFFNDAVASSCNVTAECPNTGWPGTTFACGSDGNTYYDYQAFCASQCLQIAMYYAGPCGCPNDCHSNLGRGTCVQGQDQNMTCQCNSGWSGPDCSAVACPNECSFNGECGTINGRDTCICYDGYALDDCSARIFDLPKLPDVYGSPKKSKKDKLFNDSTIAVVKLTIDPSELDWILQPENVDSEEYIKAGLWFNNQAHNASLTVGVRIKGSRTRLYVKKSWKISFDKFSGDSFHGYNSMSLVSSLQDPSYIHQKINYDLMDSMNVPHSRSSFAAVYINDVYWGLYLMMQNTDSDYLKDGFGNDDGTFYKCRHSATLAYLGSNPETYKNYRRDNHTSTSYKLDRSSTHYGDFVDFVQLVSALNASTDDEFVSQFEQILDVKEYLRELVVDVAVSNHDSYGFNANNYGFYHNTDNGLFGYIAYDTDLSWGLSSYGMDNAQINVYEWGTFSPDYRGLVTRTLKQPKFRQSYTTHFTNFLSILFNPTSTLLPRMRAMLDMIQPAAQMDCMQVIDHGYTYQDFINSYTQPIIHWDPFNKQNVTKNPHGIESYLVTRYTFAKQQLE